MDVLDGLNEAQYEVATDTTHHLLLNAPAGTGKTNTLACRAAYLIHHCHVPGDSLLFVTFTNRACKELKQRIIQRVHEKGLDVVVKTIHGFCYQLLRDEARQHGGLPADFIVYDDEDCKTILREFVQTDSFINDSPAAIQRLQNFIEIIKKETVLHYHTAPEAVTTADIVTSFLANTTSLSRLCTRYDGSPDPDWERWLRQNGASLVMYYTACLTNNGAFDFADLILNAYALLCEPERRRRWQERFTYISIDEVQDTSQLEYLLLKQLFPGRVILLCGDYFQTIYSWRGSQPDWILSEFRRDYQPRYLTFTTNYRATQTLLRAGETCLRRLFPQQANTIYPLPIQASSSVPGEPIQLHGCTNWLTEGQYIFSQIAALPPEERLRCCIMTRTNRANQQIWNSVRAHNARLPEEQRLPFTMIDQFQLFKRQECKDVIAFLRLLVQRHDVLSLSRITKRFVKRIGERTLATIMSPAYRRLGISLTDFIDDQTQRSGDSYGLLLTALKEQRIVVFDVESTGTDTSRDEIIQIAAIRLTPQGTVADQFVTYVQPTKSVGASYYVHHLSDEFLRAEGIAPKEAINQFLQFARNAVIVGHNVTYDLTILYSEMKRLGIERPTLFSYYDTLDIFRRWYPQLPNHKLSYLSDYFHIENKPSHDALADILATAGLLYYAVCQHIAPDTAKRRAALAMYLPLFTTFSQDIHRLRQASYQRRPYELIADIMQTEYVKPYYADHLYDDAQQALGPNNRLDNLRKFYALAKETDDPAQNPRDALQDLLTLTALSHSELDTLLAKKPRIPIITVHQAKGLEFDIVFLASMEEGTFPLSRASGAELVEEKRLFYVALTRAKKKLWITWHTQENQHHRRPSSFLSALDRQDTQET